MSIGGIDILLLAPAQECIGDLILRACQRYWRGCECVFQDAAEEVLHPFSEPWVWRSGTASKEFFVYQDEAAALSWQSLGAVRFNRNTMFHFLIGSPLLAQPNLSEVTLVCDRLSLGVKALVTDLRAAFLTSMAGSNGREAA